LPVLLLLGPLFVPVPLRSVPSGKGEVHLVIFHTNDVHAKIDHFARIAALVSRERRANPNVLLLSAGDNFSGNPVVDQAVPRGEPMLLLMNRLRYDAMELGNHDFDFGQPVLNRFIRKARFPVLCANVDLTAAKVRGIRPGTILRVGGLRIALLGLIQTEKESGIPSSHPARLEGMRFSDGLEYAKKLPPLRQGADVAIVLSHLGVEVDTKLAAEVPGIDLIVGGHSHTTIAEPMEINGVLIAQAGGDGQYLGRIDLTVQNGRIVEKRGTLIDLRKETAEDSAVRAMVTRFEANPSLNTVIGHVGRPLSGKSELGALMTDAVQKTLRLDVVFQNSGGIRVDQLKEPVRKRDIYQLDPFENEIVVYRMSPAEIRGLIQYDYCRRNQIDLQPAGLDYTIRATTNGDFREVVLKRLDGGTFDEGQTYTVGVNSYIASTYQFPRRDPGQSLKVTVASAILQYLGNGADLSTYPGTLRTHTELVPGGEQTEVGQTQFDISAGAAPYSGANSAGNLMTDAMASATGAALAFYPTRLVKTGISFRSGVPITTEAIPLLYSFSDRNRVVTGRILGRDIESFVLKRMQIRHNADLQIAGGTIHALRDPEGHIVSVSLTLSPGTRLEPDREYWVAFDAYEFEHNYPLSDKVRNRVLSAKTEREMLSEHLKKIGTVPPTVAAPRIVIDAGPAES